MEMKITVTQEGVVAAFGRRPINDALRDTFEAAGLYWARHFLMKHFTRAGAREYGYAPRKGENMRAGGKRFRRFAGPAEKQAGEILPLVYSGELRRASQYYRVTAKAVAKRAYVDVSLSNAHGFNRLDPRYREDISKISEAEWTVLINLINEELGRRLNALTIRRRYQIG